MIGIAVIIGAVVLGVTGALLALALKAMSAERRAGKQDARATELAVRLEVAIANGKTESARADEQEERADGLDALLDEIAANDDPSAARAHVLSRRARKAGAASAGGGDSGEVSGGGQGAGLAPGGGPDDALLKPGE